MANPYEMSAATPATSRGPSRVRYAVVGAATLVAVLLYLDRFCISFAEIYIKEDLGLTDAQIGWMLSAFFWTYALAQVPSGWLSDRFGARNMLAAYILLWSLFTGLTGLAGAFAALLLLRFGFGLGQAGAYPTCASLVSKWVPFAGRGAASSLIAVGGRVGGALAPVLTATLIVVFVPPSASSLLSSRDLLDAPRLCHDLAHGNDATAAIDAQLPAAAPVGERILAELDSTVQADIRALAERFAERAERKSAADKARQTFDEPPLDAPPQIVEPLTARLNEVIKTRDFFQSAELLALSLPREGNNLRDADRAALTPAEAERLNRLALEGAYRDSIRKVSGAGWRPVLMVYGAVGLLAAAMFWLVCRDRPADHPRVNEAELALIRHGRVAPTESDRGPVGAAPMGPLLVSRSMWLNCLMQWCTNVGWVFLVTWLPRYLASAHQVPIEQRAVMAFTPLVFGWFGMVLGGRLTDWLVGRVGLRWGRALPMSGSRFLAMAAYVYCYFFDPSPWAAVAAFSVVAFATDLGTGATWAFVQDVGGKYVGSVLGWGNMWGNLGAAVAPPLMIWIVNDSSRWSWIAWLGDSGQQNWGLAFLTCAAAFLISGLAALGVDATIPIVPEQDAN